MRTALWIVGEPGIGKSTLARALLGDLKNYTLHDKPKWTINQGTGPLIVAAGHYKGEKFDGGDTVPYNASMDAIHYWYDNLRDAELTIFDGDRFSYESVRIFLTGFVDRIACILLVGNEAEIAARRDARSKQDPSWAKGRRTKAHNFANQFRDRVIIDTERKSEEQVLREVLDFIAGPSRLETVAAQQEGLFR